jgi:5-methylthioadenosine/S-adenosylhomocysteine deaminase
MFDDYVFGIGSDGGAFTDLDLLHEARVARAIGKALTVSLNYEKTSLNSVILLKALTGWGGSLIGDLVGAVRLGYKADLIILRLDDPRVVPTYDPVEVVVTALSGREVNDVIIGGKFIIKDGYFVEFSEDELLNKVYDVIPTVMDKLKALFH